MIDVLRASTTMIVALANGASGVRAVAGVAEARELAARLGQAAVLGGERGGIRIEGFALGNSPLEYTRERVAGRELVITTTNGTAALAASRQARHVVVGAIVNRAAVARAVRSMSAGADGADVHLVCAGTDGRVTAEDVLAAGAILDAAATDPAAAGDDLDAAARAALDSFRSLPTGRAADLPTALERAFEQAAGGANLVALGMRCDLAACAQIDTYTTVPVLNPTTGRLEASPSTPT